MKEHIETTIIKHLSNGSEEFEKNVLLWTKKECNLNDIDEAIEALDFLKKQKIVAKSGSRLQLTPVGDRIVSTYDSIDELERDDLKAFSFDFHQKKKKQVYERNADKDNTKARKKERKSIVLNFVFGFLFLLLIINAIVS